jgi:hypothetical protein
MKTITLATLHLSTAQEVFDQVANHLLTQNKQSKKEPKLMPGDSDAYTPDCLYRGPGGLKCSIGCLMSDEEYSLEMEGKLLSAKIFKKLIVDFEKHDYLTKCLQSLHDSEEVSNWKLLLRELGQRESLNTEVLNKYNDTI